MSDAGPLHDYSRSKAALIGVSDYDHLPSVKPAANSLKRLEGLLTSPLCGWPKDRVRVWEKDEVRRSDRLPDQLMEAFDGVQDIALFYFVGHGQLYDDELCLALQESPQYGPRCKTLGLPFSDVRDALRACDAETKIVILDCCFAGRAREYSLAPDSANVIDWTHAKGAATLAASGAYRTAWYEPDSDTGDSQTYFTKYLIDVIEQGIPGYPNGLPLSAIYDHAAHTLVRDKRPEPTRSVWHDASRFILARNVAAPAGSPTRPPPTPQPHVPPAKKEEIQAIGPIARTEVQGAQVFEESWTGNEDPVFFSRRSATLAYWAVILGPLTLTLAMQVSLEASTGMGVLLGVLGGLFLLVCVGLSWDALWTQTLRKELRKRTLRVDRDGVTTTDSSGIQRIPWTEIRKVAVRHTEASVGVRRYHLLALHLQMPPRKKTAPTVVLPRPAGWPINARLPDAYPTRALRKNWIPVCVLGDLPELRRLDLKNAVAAYIEHPVETEHDW